MKLGITSIQRDRNPWIIEWLAFHMTVGFNQFYIYSHKCADGMTDTLKKIGEHYPVVVHELDEEDKPQIFAYSHSLSEYIGDMDWMAYIDGDEFLFPTQHENMEQALSLFNNKELSGLAVYWKCYGSSGHLANPNGLIFENFTRHGRADFPPNKHVKSILKGGHGVFDKVTPHWFGTLNGTFDESMRPVTSGFCGDHEPSYNLFRINHYVTQSYDFYRKTKRFVGKADEDPNAERPLDWFKGHDVNDEDDCIRYRFLIQLKLKIEEINQKISNSN